MSLGGVLLGIGAALVLLLVSFCLVAVEEALSRFTTVRAELLVAESEKRAKRVLALLASPDIGNRLRLLTLTTQLAEASLVALLSAAWFDGWIALLVIGTNLLLVFVLGETLPRTLAITMTERVALVGAGPVSVLLKTVPSAVLSRSLISATNLIAPGEGLHKGPFSSAEEFIELADAAVEDEVLEKTERDLIESVIEFSDTVVREVMVPRTDMVTVEHRATVAEALELTSRKGLSRLPAVGEDADDVVGLVYVKDLIKAEIDEKVDQSLVDLMRPARFIPETKKVATLLKEMQLEKFHMAVAVDEYGGTAGLVTLEDLIEELVGEIVDEYDVEEPLVQRQKDGHIRVDARILITELNDIAALKLPEGDWDTIAGLVLDHFGRVPAPGEKCVVDGHQLEVERLQGRRITRVLISPAQPTDDPDTNDASKSDSNDSAHAATKTDSGTGK